MSYAWKDLVIKHTSGGACNFQAAADDLVRDRDAEIERLRAHIAEIEAWRQQGEDLLAPASSWGEYLPSSTLFKLGNWWALRPWGKR